MNEQINDQEKREKMLQESSKQIIDVESSEALEAARGYWLQRASSERGDVPGWVLITLMTAGLVVMMWGLAGPALQSVFDAAMHKVVAF